MMCSIEELGSTKEMYPQAPENGIYIFPEGQAKPGDDAVEVLGLNDVVFEYEVTSNRVDCFWNFRSGKGSCGNLQTAVCSAGSNRSGK